MPPEFNYQGFIMRIDGDVVEIFSQGAFSHRLPLAWLAVQVLPGFRSYLTLKIGSANHDDVPLYEVLRKPKVGLGSHIERSIGTEEEPLYRQFFTELAPLCGRPVVP
jgi:hypothetical protein